MWGAPVLLRGINGDVVELQGYNATMCVRTHWVVVAGCHGQVLCHTLITTHAHVTLYTIKHICCYSCYMLLSHPVRPQPYGMVNRLIVFRTTYIGNLMQ